MYVSKRLMSPFKNRISRIDGGSMHRKRHRVSRFYPRQIRQISSLRPARLLEGRRSMYLTASVINAILAVKSEWRIRNGIDSFKKLLSEIYLSESKLRIRCSIRAPLSTVFAKRGTEIRTEPALILVSIQFRSNRTNYVLTSKISLLGT